MAKVKLNWTRLRFYANDVLSWKDLKEYAEDDNAIEKLRSKDSVYVIRLCRPWCIAYPAGNSPVLYIGMGDAKARLRSHLSGWMVGLRTKISDLQVEICVSEPILKKTQAVCDQVEADLIYKFEQRFGHIPQKNKVRPHNIKHHTYDLQELLVLRCGQGGGYHFAIKPIGSSNIRRD